MERTMRVPVKAASLLFVLLALATCGRTALAPGRGDAAELSDTGQPDTGLPSCPACDQHAWCAESGAGVRCTCRDGFTGDGHTCLDIDECAQGTAPCDRQHGVCTNTEGGYTCSCAAGWWLGKDGTSCLDTLPAVQVASGGGRVCVLGTDGALACWGETTPWLDPTPPAGTFKQVAVGWFYSCGLRTDGTIACWGDFTSAPPIAPPPAGTFSQVAVGGYGGCALRTDGKVVCWGSGMNGETTPPPGRFQQIDSLTDHTCGLQSNGRVACWGQNTLGEANPPSDTFSQVSAGAGASCGVRTDGSLACWGGLGPPPSGSFTQVAVGNAYACALRTDGSVTCWGQPYTPEFTSPAGTFEQIDAGGCACGLRANGAVTCWRTNGEEFPPSSCT
jgi:alpha-tubulin suppressor-like RCC1 family protein